MTLTPGPRQTQQRGTHATLGLGLDYILMAVAPNLVWLFVGRIISGITAASFSTANAYIADVTPQEDRAGAFGLIGAAFGIGVEEAEQDG